MSRNVNKNGTHVGVAISVLAAGVGLAITPAAHADFVYNDFNSVAGLTLNGDAVHTAPTISVTPPDRRTAGSFYATDKQNVEMGFVTNFTFRFRDVTGTGADGFAFLIQNSSVNAVGGEGGALGYGTNFFYQAEPGQTGIANSVAIEFDAWNNQSDWADFNNDNHISVQTMGLAANSPAQSASRGAVNSAIDFTDGQIHTVRIAYVPGTLSIYLDDLSAPALDVAIDLGSTLSLDGIQSWVGFTAGTGAFTNVQRHEILSWNFTGTIPAPGAASLLATGGLLAARRRRRSF